ncbi:sigma 54-interacting transcriptional regulator [bacterium]|nr:sigma 54-interacting transcriptional regulator [bacterium]
MNPFLLCMFGPIKGSRIELPNEPIVLGRERSNAVYIGDLLLSRKHCSIEKQDNSYVVRDLQSRNGVFVNGIPIHERTLNHGDRIEIGASTFLFLLNEDSTFPDFPVVDDSLEAGSTQALRIEDSVYLGDTPSFATKSAKVLTRISHVLTGATDVVAFCEKLFDLLLEFIPYENVSILETKGTRISASRFTKQQVQKFSESLSQKVIHEKVAILASNFALPESLSGSQIQSVICVPFIWLESVVCLLYMDTTNAVGFTEDHLQIASAVAALTSPVLHHLRETEDLRLQNQQLNERLVVSGPIVGESEAVRKVLQLISRIAPVDTTVLIYGESGTGKELAARAIHAAGARRNGPLISISCAAIPESLLESELFGFEKGAFTGAFQQKKGKIESADGGTLFLDEIGELAPALQAKLLRVLQEREFERVGGTRAVTVDIRVIAATNQNLEKMIEEGKFRRDLYYRLKVVTLTMPPLRELSEDVLLLSHYFVSRFTKKIGRRILGISPEVKECLLRYDWPGNVRELQNAIERAIALGTSEWIQLEDLPEALLERRSLSQQGPLSYQDALLQFKRDLVLKAFEGTKGNYNEAASRLGIHPNYLYRLVKNLNLRDEI